MAIVSADNLTDFAARLFEAVGVPKADARTVSASLVGANLRGHDSHGVMRVPQYVDFLRQGQYRIGVELLIESETEAIAICDAQWGLGQVQAHRLLDIILPKAKKLGLASGTARHCGHIGRLGEYAERVAEEGLILLATVNNNGSGHRVAPPGGYEPRLATNPLCAGVPVGDDDPVVLDFGTSVVAEGKVRSFYLDGKRPVPDGWLLDPQGRPTNNSSVLYEKPLGSILPMGGIQAYKGFGLSLVLDLLAGGLSGGRCIHPDAPPVRGNNTLFLILDPEKFAGAEKLSSESSTATRFIRDCPRVEGVETIMLPGDPERNILAKRSVDGISLPQGHWDKLTSLAQELGVATPD